MPSGRQGLYGHANSIVQLLSSDLPEEDTITQIEPLVVSNIIPPLAKPYLSIQLDTVDKVRKAISQGIAVHVLAILPECISRIRYGVSSWW